MNSENASDVRELSERRKKRERKEIYKIHA